MPASSACSCRRRARSKPASGCSSSIPTPASSVRPPNVEPAIEGIAALLRGEPADLTDVALDVGGIPDFHARVYAFTRGIPRGETITYGEIASKLRLSGAVHSVAQALARNPFVIIVPCHRVLEAGGYADRMSAEWRGDFQAPAAVDRRRARRDREQDPVRRAAAGCSAPPAGLNSAP